MTEISLTYVLHSAEETVRHKVDAIIDVWCEAPVDPRWEEVADSAVQMEQREDLWGGLEYWFVMGMFQDQHFKPSPFWINKVLLGVHPCVGMFQIIASFRLTHG